MNKKLALIAALAVVGVFAAVVVFTSDIEESEFASKVFKFRAQKNLTALFKKWKKQHNKTYGGVEHDRRYNIFCANYKRIQKINSNKKNTFTVGLNKFADLSKAEFSSLYLGLKKKNVTKKAIRRVDDFDAEVEIEDLKLKKNVKDTVTVDWRTKGVVTPVKDQGQCGSCWAFSTTGALEGLNAIKTGTLLSFSEQQLVDCAGSTGNEGCNGGMMEWAMQYTQTDGIMQEGDYPYTAEDGDCQYDKSKATTVNAGGYKDYNSDSALQTAVTAGPVSVSVEADQDVFQYYTSGILNSADCGTELDHGILAVGYGTSGSTGYWIVKNSWGSSWGNNGYIQIARKSKGDGICGINMDNTAPVA